MAAESEGASTLIAKIAGVNFKYISAYNKLKEINMKV